MKRSLSIVFVLVLGCTLSGLAQTRKYSNEFLNIGVGARALGMSNSFIVSANDVTAGYWNPAGLAAMGNQHQLTFMHSEYFAGIAKYDYGAFATRLDSNSVLGASIVRFGVDDIPNTTELIDANGNVNYDRITKFSAVDFALLISYAKSFHKLPGLRLGANVKVIRRRVGDFAGAWGFGLDAGAQYDLKKWKFAVMARDVTSTFNAWSYNLSDATKAVFQTTGNEIPENSVEITMPKLLLGVARKFDLSPKISLLAESDLDITYDGKRNVMFSSDVMSIDPHIGVEASYSNIIFVRGGLGNYQSYTDAAHRTITTIQPNIGVGIHVKAFYLDYALTDIGDQSVALYSHVFTVKFEINKKAK